MRTLPRIVVAAVVSLGLLAGSTGAQSVRQEFQQEVVTPRGVGSYELSCESGDAGSSLELWAPPGQSEAVGERLSSFLEGMKRVVDGFGYEMPVGAESGPIWIESSGRLNCQAVWEVATGESVRSISSKSGVALTSEEVAAHREQLAALAARTNVVTGANSTKNESKVATNVTYGFSSRDGGLMGLAAATQWDLNNRLVAPEIHLWFSLNTDEACLLRNPERRQVCAVSATRNDPNSDVMGRDEPFFESFNEGDLNASDASLPDPTYPARLEVYLSPLIDTSDPDVAGWLRVDNFDVTSTARLGRGLESDHVVRSYHGKFSERDVHVFNVLLKVGKARVGDDLNHLGAPSYDTTITYGRNEEVNSYWADVCGWTDDSPVREKLGCMGVDIEVTWDGQGRLDSYVMSIDQENTATSKDICFYMSHPKSRGDLWYAGDPGFGVVCIVTQTSDSNSFTDLLDGTTWLSPK